MMQMDWHSTALELFRRQAVDCLIYREYLQAIGCRSDQVVRINDIPFLPIEFFKKHRVVTGNWTSEHIFQSSGTTSELRSKHHVRSMAQYLSNSQLIFESLYGPLENMAILALLPGYAPESSLVAMVSHFIKKSHHSISDFFSNQTNFDSLQSALLHCRHQGILTLLIGVTYSLLDFANVQSIEFPELIIMETGGMKGQKKELIRKDVHDLLTSAFGVEKVHSEYGMTELLSQAYSQGDGLFMSNSRFKIFPGDLYDPLSATTYETTARINVMDLANEHSCAFIATNDLGKVYHDGSFEIIGRQDFSEIRGCNLLMM
jgi:hypothetical protein